ncbi:hypothetical protein AMECASPLE_023764 [Ameca splendens]|uniref:Uncharacterized protein n=1 Tax=Ameca splendens TaxID=208324 RepID=A0ABV1AAH4_9TELE
MVGVSAHWSTCGSRCLGLGALVCAGSFLVAACQGLDPWALLGLCLGRLYVLGSQVSGSMARSAWASLQLPGASAQWLLGGSPGTVPCSSLGGLWLSRLWFSRGSCALGGLWMSIARISFVSLPGPGGQVCGSSHSLLHIFIEKPCVHKCTHTQTHRCLDSGVNRYTNIYTELHLPLITFCIHK